MITSHSITCSDTALLCGRNSNENSKPKCTTFTNGSSTREKKGRGQMRFYEMNKDASSVLINTKYKVKNYKVSYRYIKYVDKHLTRNEKSKEHADNHFVQSIINSDDSRTTKYMMKKILSEFVQYIAHKE
jgi:hypothetical protein